MTEIYSRTHSLIVIQYLRALAAISVLIYHASRTYNLEFSIGAAGVDIFFVISGIIMWITAFDRPITPQEFITRRLIRIVPIYWLATVFTFALINFKPQFFPGHDGSFQNLVRSLLFIPNTYEFGLRPVVLQGWTLCYELFFYIIFASSIIFKKFQRLIFSLFVLIFLVSFHLTLSDKYFFILTDPILLEFAAGLVIGAALTSEKKLHPKFSFSLIIAGLIYFLAVDATNSNIHRVIAWGVPSAMLVAGAVFWEREQGIKEIRWLHFLGDASYSIYIWHVFAKAIIIAAALRLGIPQVAQPIVVILCSLAATIAAYIFIEQPINKITKFKRSKVPQLQ